MKPMGFGAKTPNSARPKGARNKTFRAKLQQRRVDAVARQAEYDKLSIKEKIKLLDQGGFRAARQRAKLKKQLESPPAPVVVVDHSKAGAALEIRPPKPVKKKHVAPGAPQ